MWESLAWGLLAGSSLVLGRLIAMWLPIGPRLLGLVMAFGAGVRISAVSFELVHEAFETSSGDGGVAPASRPRRSNRGAARADSLRSDDVGS